MRHPLRRRLRAAGRPLPAAEPDPQRAVPHPVIVGVAQATWRDAGAPDPIEMCAEVVAAAAGDAGAGGALLRRAGSLGVVDIASRRWSDPAALVAARLGLEPRERLRTTLGGDGPQVLLSDMCSRIAEGALDVGIVCGAEALATLAAAMKAGAEPDWPALDEGAAPTRVLGSERFPASDAEVAANLIAPVAMYPLFESALWAERGGTIDAHRARLGELWARFAQVAVANPHAWWRGAIPSAKEIATPGPHNRLVTQPYPKLLNSNIQTDQAAALIVCSDELARELGVDRDRWVHVHAAGHACDHWTVSEREDLHSSPAIRFAGRGALAGAGVTIDEVAHLDIYSCFPSAVQIACRELGVDPWTDARAPTVTGGLTFAGGPGNNYVTHALAAMAVRLREDPGALGLTTAVGWYLTKHATCVLGGGQPRRGFTAANVQAQVDATPRREAAAGIAGAATGEAASIVYGRDGAPAVASVTALLDDGRRTVASSGDAGVLAAIVDAPLAGRQLHLDGAGGFTL